MLQTLVSIRDHQLDACQPPLDEPFEEGRPEGLGLRRADVQADDLAPPVGVDRHSDYHRDGHDPTAFALSEIGRIEPQIGPLALQRTVEEGADPLVDVLAQLRDLGLGDACEAHRLD